MIKYALICQNQHVFDTWFRDSAAFDEQSQNAALACPVCGNQHVEKTLMAPAIMRKSNAKSAKKPRQKQVAKADEKGGQKLVEKRKNTHEIMQMMGCLHDHVVEHFDYVGADFAEEARAMHYGEKESRDIYGESTPEEALALYEEGVPAASLPIVPEKYKN